MLLNDEEYKQIVNTTVITTIDIIFLNSDNAILLWLRNNEPLKWVYYIPWWRRIKNEIIYESVIRKSKEELWIDIDINKLQFLWIYDDIYHNSKYDNIWMHCSPQTFIYRMSDEEVNNIKIDEQHSDYSFFDIESQSLHENIKIRIQDMKEKRFI